jgi:hypothetical protein
MTLKYPQIRNIFQTQSRVQKNILLYNITQNKLGMEQLKVKINTSENNQKLKQIWKYMDRIKFLAC